MRTNKSAHQLIQNKDGLFLNTYDPACTPVFEWVSDPSRAWVFHPLNSKGKDLLVRIKLNEDAAAKLVDRADAITEFNTQARADLAACLARYVTETKAQNLTFLNEEVIEDIVGGKHFTRARNYSYNYWKTGQRCVATFVYDSIAKHWELGAD